MAEAQITLTKKNANGDILFVRAGYSTIVVETTDLHLGHTDYRKLISAIRLELSDIRGDNNPNVEIGYRDTLAESVTYTFPVPVGQGADMVFKRINSKYFRIRLSLSGNAAYFVWSGLEFFGGLAGRRSK